MEDQHIEAFTFGDPEPVLTGQYLDNLGVFLLDNGQYYQPPVPWTGLARLLRANAYHGPIIEFKTIMVLRGFVPSTAVSRQAMRNAVTDYNVFANCYFQLIKNHFGEVVRAPHLPAINMRRLKGANHYGLLDQYGQLQEFEPGEVVHIKNYDVSQTIYGLPGYLGAIQSMLLNEDATLFRRRYYKNGAHVGYILYSSSPMEPVYVDDIKKAMKESKGVGNFRNMFLHSPNGDKDGIKIIPVGDFSTKDELEKIKNISRDDIIAAHRMPPALAAIIPQNMTGFGDVTKTDEVYEKNEVWALRDTLMELNEHLPVRLQISFGKRPESGI